MRLGRAFTAIVFLLIGCPSAWAQQPQSEAAPVPTKIYEAKKVFVSNAGVDAASPVAFERTAGANDPYSQFYFAIQRWGRYEVVGTPSDADLILQLRLSAPLSSCETYEPQTALTIMDSNTHFALWTITRRVKDARLRDNWDKNLSESMANIVDELKRIATQATVARR